MMMMMMMMPAQLGGLKKTRSGAATYCTLASSYLACFFPSNISNSSHQCPQGDSSGAPALSKSCVNKIVNLRWSVEVEDEDHPV